MKLTNSNPDIHLCDVFKFEFFIYIPQDAPPTTIHRATAGRISESAIAIAAVQQSNPQFPRVPIATHHLTIHHARQPSGTPVVLPTDNTTRQAIALDQMAAALPSHEQIEGDDVEVEVKLFGHWIQITIQLSSLRTALNLPQYDIFSAGIFMVTCPMYLHSPWVQTSQTLTMT